MPNRENIVSQWVKALPSDDFKSRKIVADNAVQLSVIQHNHNYMLHGYRKYYRVSHFVCGQDGKTINVKSKVLFKATKASALYWEWSKSIMDKTGRVDGSMFKHEKAKVIIISIDTDLIKEY